MPHLSLDGNCISSRATSTRRLTTYPRADIGAREPAVRGMQRHDLRRNAARTGRWLGGPFLLLLVTRHFAFAQITLDGTLGQKGPLQGPNYVITSSKGQQVGGNLFRSFGDFNIHRNESATFTGPASIDNVIGRVTL